MRVWITGIAGFLGSHIAENLIAAGHDVCGNDSLICGSAENIKNICKPPHDFVQYDCCDFDQMKKALNWFNGDVLIHCAATAHEGLSNFSPSFITRNIYEASVSTFSAAIASGVKRIVFMSSMARYGHGYQYCQPPFTEDMPPAPVDPYGIAKVAAEETLKALCRLHGVKCSILVPHNIIGTRQRVEPFRNVATIMINRCLSRQLPLIYGDGLQTRCFSPVADCLPTIIKAVHGEADGHVVNIGPDGGEITIKELAEKIMSLTNYTNDPEYIEGRPNEVKHAFCSSDKARRLLGYEPKQSLDDCLAEMVKHHVVEDFKYEFPIEIAKGCPKVWMEKLL